MLPPAAHMACWWWLLIVCRRQKERYSIRARLSFPNVGNFAAHFSASVTLMTDSDRIECPPPPAASAKLLPCQESIIPFLLSASTAAAKDS